MPWQDRDYYRSPAPLGLRGRLRLASITTWLIILNIAVFVLDGLLGRVLGPVAIRTPEGLLELAPLTALGHFSEYLGIHRFQVWRFITFQFLHSGIGHIFWNMLSLYFFGAMVEQFLGSRRYLAFYLLCGVAGALTYLLLWASGLFISTPYDPLVGASAGILGILVGAATVAPDTQVMMLFPPIPISLRALAWIFVGIAVFVVAMGGANAGGEAAHLGGALAGFALIKLPGALGFAERLWPDRTIRRASERRRRRRAERIRRRAEEEDEQVDRILDKVRDRGLQSLTRAEKRILQRATERQRAEN